MSDRQCRCGAKACDYSKQCKSHCSDQNGHSHCIVYYCSSEKMCDLNVVDDLCIDDCQSRDHSHCSFPGCSRDKTCFEDSVCIFHCEILNHNHCIRGKCGNLDVCSESSLCKYHCTYANHSHCLENKCDKDMCSESVSCFIHCTQINHGHCRILSCNSIDLCGDECKFHCIKRKFKHKAKHCITFSCDKTKNICKTTKICIESCPKKNHNCKDKHTCNSKHKCFYCLYYKKLETILKFDFDSESDDESDAIENLNFESLDSESLDFENDESSDFESDESSDVESDESLDFESDESLDSESSDSESDESSGCILSIDGNKEKVPYFLCEDSCHQHCSIQNCSKTKNISMLTSRCGNCVDSNYIPMSSKDYRRWYNDQEITKLFIAESRFKELLFLPKN